MKLQSICQNGLKIGFEGIAADKELSTQIQVLLIGLNLLQPPADGKFGPVSSGSLKSFQKLMAFAEPDFVGKLTAEALIEMKSENLPKPKLALKNDWAGKITQYMLNKGHTIFIDSRERNIVYVEDCDAQGKPLPNTPNAFNDRSLIIQFVNNEPRIIFNVEGTTEPGAYYTYNPMCIGGAARVAFGQYSACWQVGMHGVSRPHEALRQVRPIRYFRDKNNDFCRSGDVLETGTVGINQHGGFDYPKNDIAYASAGCLVRRKMSDQSEFMRIIKQDWRYQANEEFSFSTTLLPGDEVAHVVVK